MASGSADEETGQDVYLNDSINPLCRRGLHGGKRFARLNFADEEGFFILEPIKIQPDTVPFARIIIKSLRMYVRKEISKCCAKIYIYSAVKDPPPRGDEPNCQKKMRLLKQNVGALGHMQIPIPIVIKPRNGLFSTAASSPVGNECFAFQFLYFILSMRQEERGGFYTKIIGKFPRRCSLFNSEGS